ncbi:MotA/TolQ/ExbB proton channel family protein [Desulfovibrio psychrotolerans]|uniref:Biopolymer transporter ExbB n=1 Tax=Desulfovibrio psychrotolerans TaxID=415242 RepID=A0A7J0BT12_9BACT|nr:MotA/TolQ/ExbB proton channel family protein [Desulfovibrio psychrotolerans]GFM36275.1 biopolymer transporter ExbB [Desulfovibrio psychrotolerans]
MRTMIIWIQWIMLICLLAAPQGVWADQAAPAAAAGKDLRTVGTEAEATKQQAQETLSRVARDITAERQALQQELARIKTAAAQARTRATALETELRALRDEESTLARALDGKQDTLRKIGNTIRDNARLLKGMGATSFAASMHGEWQPRLALMSDPERFPSLEDVIFLMHSLLRTAQDSGHAILTQETVLGRDGAAITASVLRVGAMQAVYSGGAETGFLLPRPEAGPLHAAPYVPSAAETERIRAVLTGPATPLPAPDSNVTPARAAVEQGTVPMDFSGAMLLSNPPEPRTLLTSLREGGIFLWPILLIGLAGCLIVAERCFVLARIRINGKQAVEQGKQGEQGEQGISGAGASPAERVVKRILADGATSAEAMEKRLEESILEELPPLERFLQTLRVLAAVSPLLGLLGTVSGIIQTFRVITAHGNGDPKLLSAGISEALLTTEVGLFTAIPLLLCHHFLTRRVHAVVLDMEVAGTSLITMRHNGETS